MTSVTLVRRSLWHYRRGNLAVVLGVATAVAVLAGALLVGDSVRGTLRDLATNRLGATDVAVTSPGFFGQRVTEAVARDDQFRASFEGVAPLVALDGFVTVQTTGRRAGNVRVYGVDDRFWRFHDRPKVGALGPRQAYVSPALAEETGAAVNVPILVRVDLPSDIPLESLHGRKDDPGRSMRATVAAVLSGEVLGEFTLSQAQGRVRAVFVSLAWLSESLEIGDRVNTLVVSSKDGGVGDAAGLTPIVRRHFTPGDLGLTIQPLSREPVTVVASEAGLLDDRRVAAVGRAAETRGLHVEPVLTYLANAIRVGSREVPYSLVTARDLAAIPSLPPFGNSAAAAGLPPIVLNAWAARELAANVGQVVELEYYRWVDPGHLVTGSASFRMAGVVPIGSGDRDLAPAYPGITDSPTLDDWNPPFPIDLRRVRPADEAYWTEHRTTPKAFIPIEEGQRLWGSRYGQVTSLRLTSNRAASSTPAGSFPDALTRELDPAAVGVSVRDVRREALAAAAGVTDFGQYFIYFSFFLVVSALVLAVLFFKLGVDERAREVGLFAALGAAPTFVRRVFATEALVLSVAGGAIGAGGAVAYAAAIVYLLRTWWMDAVGTSVLELHVSTTSLVIGFAGGVTAALVCTALALGALRSRSPRALLAGSIDSVDPGSATFVRLARVVAVSAGVLSVGLMAAGLGRAISVVGAFFGAGALMLLAGLAGATWWFSRPRARVLAGHGPRAVVALGVRSAAARPTRSALAIAVLASAVFIVLAVDVFRKGAISDTGRASGVGGYGFVAESLLPVAHDLGTAAGREAAGLSGLNPTVRLDAFRLRPGDDASCLNLYQPTSPRLLGVPETFIVEGRFSFRGSLARTESERANPWLLLTAEQPDGAVPVIGDANSLTYVWHKAVGDVIEIPHAGRTVQLRVVAALADSILQRELVMSEAAFVRLFPEHEGFRFWLVDASADAGSVDVAATVEDRLASYGVDVLPSTDLLAEFHRVENTYLSTFQTLGGLGLLLGTIGLAAILLRAVVERRRELALLGAVGYRPSDVRLMLLAETAVLLLAGLVIGVAAATVASAPAIAERGGRSPLSAAGLLLVGVVILAGVLATSLAARVATRQALVGALRSE